jgi:hypothetical protein
VLFLAILTDFGKLSFFCRAFSWAQLRAIFLRPAASRLLLFPFLLTNLLEAPRNLVVLMAKVSAFLT